MKIKAKETFVLCTYTHVSVRSSDTYVCRHEPAYIVKVQEAMKGRFYALKIAVWNESHNVWELFQIPIFQLYKALHGIFQKTHRKSYGKT